MKAVRMSPSDPRFERVQNLLALLGLAVNPACDFFGARQDSPEWRADLPQTRENIEAALEQALTGYHDG